MHTGRTGYLPKLFALVLLGGAVSVPAQAADSTGCTRQERSNQTLGEKLNQTKGVICPPDVDPAMKAPTPDTGDTPVIRPPGTPGGDPRVQPK
jgi:hypothetical protein